MTTVEPTSLVDMFEFTNVIENSTNRIYLLDPTTNSTSAIEARHFTPSMTTKVTKSVPSTLTTKSLPLMTTAEQFEPTLSPLTGNGHPAKGGYHGSIYIMNGYFPYRDVTTKADPFIEIWCDMRDISTTPVIKNTHYPHFNYRSELGHVTRDSVIKLYVWDEDPYKNDYYGNIYIYVSNVLDQGQNGTAQKYSYSSKGWFLVGVSLWETS